jgi:alpha-L-arabinofuranosidase
VAVIKLDLDRVLGSVDRRILGGFTEHLGRCVYGGVFDEGSPLSDADGFRTDVIEAVRRLKPPLLRWPGGNFVSGYHFADGIGPVGSRPRRKDLAWHTEESNRFGTDEFMRYCELVGAEPYLCVNMGTGTMDEAHDWVEYCNGTGDTYWANQRRANGHEEPYGVRLWGLGNEVYGSWQIGQMSAADYVTAARQFAKVMTWTDPTIELVSCGETGWSDWDRTVIEGLAEFVRYHSLHIYTGSEDYWTNVLAPHQTERALRITSAIIEQTRYNQRISHPIYVAYDEWNVWFREREGKEGLEERYNLADALAVATFLHAFVRHCKVVRVANLAQLVNVIAPIVTSPEGLFLQSIYHPLRLFADHLGDQALDVFVESDRHQLSQSPEPDPWPYRIADDGPFPVLDAVATYSPGNGQLMLSVINRDPANDVTAEIQFANPLRRQTAAVEEVNSDSIDATNSFDVPDRVNVSAGTVEKFGNGATYTFPAHSLTVLTMRCEAE